MTQVPGLALMGAALVVMLVAFISSAGFDDEITPFIGIAVLLVVVTFLVWRFDALWSRVLGLVAAVGLFAMLWFFVFSIFQIFSPVEFFGGLAFLAGFILALVGGIRAISAGRKGVEATEGEARLRKRALTGLVVLTAVSIVGLFFTRGTVSEAEASGAAALNMFSFEFDPHSSTVVAGGKLLVHNSDVSVHDFTLDALGIAVTILPGGDALVDLSGAAPGTYSYICTLHTDPSDLANGMTGVLTISG